LRSPTTGARDFDSARLLDRIEIDPVTMPPQAVGPFNGSRIVAAEHIERCVFLVRGADVHRHHHACLPDDIRGIAAFDRCAQRADRTRKRAGICARGETPGDCDGTDERRRDEPRDGAYGTADGGSSESAHFTPSRAFIGVLIAAERQPMMTSRRTDREAVDVVVGEPYVVQTRDRAIGGRVIVEYPCNNVCHDGIPLRPPTEGRALSVS